MAVLVKTPTSGRGGAQAFAAVAKKNSIEVISTDFHPQSYPDFTSLLTRIQQSKPPAIAIFQLAGDQLNFLRNAMQLGVRIPLSTASTPAVTTCRSFRPAAWKAPSRPDLQLPR